MSVALYPRLAWDAIRKNRKLYLPYILTCIGMVTMYYVIDALSSSTALSTMTGARTATALLRFGRGVMSVFSVLFLFYTNSFLMRRRRKEFGLYNILGMGKRNIAVILLWEALIIALISLAAGLAAGVILLKYAEVILVRLIRGTVNLAITFSMGALVRTASVFGVIYLLLLLNAIRSVHVANPIALLHSESVGEKPPRGNWLLGVLGAALLAGAYALAVSIKTPMSALQWFFIAVLMVIVATYLLFVAGSVLLCRVLQRNKRYYYQANHFVSVSSLVYRMKRNGAGLASVCILATMVLVMIGSTSCLYFGAQSHIQETYSQETSISLQVFRLEDLAEDRVAQVRGLYEQVFAAHKVTPKKVVDCRMGVTYGLLTDGVLETNYDRGISFSYDDLRYVTMVTAADYNRIMGTDLAVEPGQAYIATSRCTYTRPHLRIGDVTWSVAGHIRKGIGINDNNGIAPGILLVIADMQELQPLAAANGEQEVLTLRYYYGYDIGTTDQLAIDVYEEQYRALRELDIRDEDGGYGYRTSCLAADKADLYGTYGGLFFLGILLSLVFLLATVLIIYYKQMTEGYEDQARFTIMQNVGMSKRDIRRSINSQMLTVFLAPPLMAVLHFCFAFPLIHKLLMLLGMKDLTFLLVTAGISVAIFLLLYMAVYRVTARAYYGIVSDAGRQ